MNKLEEKFETIIYENTGGTTFHMSDDALNAAKVCVEEAKTIAIEFHNWVYDTSILLGRQSGKEVASRIWLTMKDGDRFDKFIEEYYK